MIGHVSPEAFVGGPIALVQDEDTVVIDSQSRTLDIVRTFGVCVSLCMRVCVCVC